MCLYRTPFLPLEQQASVFLCTTPGTTRDRGARPRSPPLLPVCSPPYPHSSPPHILIYRSKRQPVKRGWRTYFWTVSNNSGASDCIHRLQASKHLASSKGWRPQLLLAIFSHPRYSQFTPVGNVGTPSPTWWSPKTASRNTQQLPTTDYLHPIHFTISMLHHHFQALQSFSTVVREMCLLKMMMIMMMMIIITIIITIIIMNCDDNRLHLLASCHAEGDAPLPTMPCIIPIQHHDHHNQN